MSNNSDTKNYLLIQFWSKYFNMWIKCANRRPTNHKPSCRELKQHYMAFTIKTSIFANLLWPGLDVGAFAWCPKLKLKEQRVRDGLHCVRHCSTCVYGLMGLSGRQPGNYTAFIIDPERRAHLFTCADWTDHKIPPAHTRFFSQKAQNLHYKIWRVRLLKN